MQEIYELHKSDDGMLYVGFTVQAPSAKPAETTVESEGLNTESIEVAVEDQVDMESDVKRAFEKVWQDAEDRANERIQEALSKHQEAEDLYKMKEVEFEMLRVDYEERLETEHARADKLEKSKQDAEEKAKAEATRADAAEQALHVATERAAELEKKLAEAVRMLERLQAERERLLTPVAPPHLGAAEDFFHVGSQEENGDEGFK